MSKEGFGDPSKLSTEQVSRRARRAVLRNDPPDTYSEGGKVRGAGAAQKGVKTAEIV